MLPEALEDVAMIIPKPSAVADTTTVPRDGFDAVGDCIEVASAESSQHLAIALVCLLMPTDHDATADADAVP
jgi:hypothetical protein